MPRGATLNIEGITKIVQSPYGNFMRAGSPTTDDAPFVPFDVAAGAQQKMTVLDSVVGVGGCKVVPTWTARDALYRTLVAAIRAAEK